MQKYESDMTMEWKGKIVEIQKVSSIFKIAFGKKGGNESNLNLKDLRNFLYRYIKLVRKIRACKNCILFTVRYMLKGREKYVIPLKESLFHFK